MVKLRRAKRGTTRSLNSPRGSRLLPLGMMLGPAGGIVSGLLTYWKLAVFLILLAFISYQNMVSFEFLKPFGIRTIPGVLQDAEEAKELLAAREEQLATCEDGRETLKNEIATTNAQVEKWFKLSQDLRADSALATAALADLKATSTTELEIILQGPVPQTCEGAIKLLKEAVTKGELSWKPNG